MCLVIGDEEICIEADQLREALDRVLGDKPAVEIKTYPVYPYYPSFHYYPTINPQPFYSDPLPPFTISTIGNTTNVPGVPNSVQGTNLLARQPDYETSDYLST